LVVALGDAAFTVERPFGPPGAGFRGGRISDVAVDSAGRPHVLVRYDRYVDPIGLPVLLLLSPEGSTLRSFELPEVGDGHGLAIGPADEILITDRDRHEIRILDAEGRVIRLLGARNRPGHPFSHPTAAAIHPGGEIYVTDGYGNAQVHRFAADGRLLQSWGRPGRGPGEFSTPHALAFGRQGEVIVCDRENDRLQVFDPQGAFLREISDICRPMAVAVDPDGCILVSDQVPRLSRFSPEGRLLGRCRPVLNGGHGLARDATGRILLAEIADNRVTRLVPRG
jgi:peptidylglycine monooxygenase